MSTENEYLRDAAWARYLDACRAVTDARNARDAAHTEFAVLNHEVNKERRARQSDKPACHNFKQNPTK